MKRVAVSKSSLFNAAGYQAGWFACVLGAAGGWETLGASVAIILALVHVYLAVRPEREWPLLLAALGIGIMVDTLHAAFGVLDFRGHEAGTIAPIWIMALWLQFGTVLHFCMSWLSKRYFFAGSLGLFGGPLAFLGGEHLGAASFGEPRALSLLVIGVSWAVVLPALVLIADRLAGIGRYRIFPRYAGTEASVNPAGRNTVPVLKRQSGF